MCQLMLWFSTRALSTLDVQDAMKFFRCHLYSWHKWYSELCLPYFRGGSYITICVQNVHDNAVAHAFMF
ncbi:hypothetical protein M6B38_351880 [Iris pallida]|uniref:Uncharacterized protein n=1 Tax=Iris pallida TaxID=29817 RepID=A0AAX6GR05_IRIPA|nr:hypothetical protein M6B38_351880 [Iris pallida]